MTTNWSQVKYDESTPRRDAEEKTTQSRLPLLIWIFHHKERDNTFHHKERDNTMHASSELRQWFLEWLDGNNGPLNDAAIDKLNELRSCTDELPAGYCQHGKLHVPFGISYGVAVQKILGEKD